MVAIFGLLLILDVTTLGLSTIFGLVTIFALVAIFDGVTTLGSLNIGNFSIAILGLLIMF